MDNRLKISKLYRGLLGALCVVLAAFSVTACLHDEEESVSVTIIDGTWFGVEEDVNNSLLKKIRFTISGGRITAVAREDLSIMTGDDMVDQGLIGTVSIISARNFTFTLSDDTVGGFYIDTTAAHMTFLDDKFRFGVMQKGATDVAAMPDINDIAGDFSGFSVNVSNGATMPVNNESSSSATVTADTLALSLGVDNAGSVTGGNFEGNMFLLDSERGVYNGNWMNSVDNMIAGNMVSIVSTDKTFAATRICLTFMGVPNIEECTFAAWNK